MARSKTEMYAMLESYDNLVIPVNLLEQIVREGYFARTGYENGKDFLKDLSEVKKVSMWSREDIDSALAQQALEGK